MAAAQPLIAFLLASQPSTPPAASLVWIGGIAGFWLRKQPIGGWLFFFFWQVAAGIAVSVATTWSSLAPRAWNDQAKYFAYVFSTAPRMAVLLAIASVGYMLIRTYDWKWVIVMRYLLIVFVIFGVISVGVDSMYLPNRVAADIGSLIFPVAYAIYFHVSERVRSVFLRRMWNHRAVAASQ